MNGVTQGPSGVVIVPVSAANGSQTDLYQRATWFAGCWIGPLKVQDSH
jgi:hypothetical protein